ncbi:MAG: TRIC cation channel family protein [Propionibacteriales bacterium]|nr:TRIC cation channel family protein [Propionibacteriales bacterium]
MPSSALVTLDLIGIAAFAITGALVGVRKQLDVYGVASSP